MSSSVYAALNFFRDFIKLLKFSKPHLKKSFLGAAGGMMSSMLITGYFSASWWGWPAAFYFFGIIGFIWCIFWVIYSAETPAAHGRISEKERKYIEHSLGQQDDHLVR